MNNANKKLSEEEKAKRRLLLQDLAQWREETGSNSLVRYAQEKGVSHPYLSLVAKWERSSQRNHRNSTKEVAPFTKMGRQPMERSMFIFCGSSNKVVKMLVWDHN
ncbi:MAG: transposase, partial [Proteobacteria bacterium]|nr:transposase [Pseudomonadota bacterium]